MPNLFKLAPIMQNTKMRPERVKIPLHFYPNEWGTPDHSPPEGYAQTSPRILLPRLSSAGFDRRGNFFPHRPDGQALNWRLIYEIVFPIIGCFGL